MLHLGEPVVGTSWVGDNHPNESIGMGDESFGRGMNHLGGGSTSWWGMNHLDGGGTSWMGEEPVGWGRNQLDGGGTICVG